MEMTHAQQLDLLQRKIAAELLAALIASKQIQFTAAAGKAKAVVPDAAKAYSDLLAAISVPA